MRHYTPAHAQAPAGAQRGVSLVEALIALLVTAFGLLALGGLQVTLARHADAARQRGEATRLAQQPLEALRSHATVAAWDAATSGSDMPPATNVTYTRTVTLTEGSGGAFRIAEAAVTWTDRASEPQRLRVSTVVARTDPLQVGAVAFPQPGGGTLKRPHNRSLAIPFPAKDIGKGMSRHDLGNGTSVVFQNVDGKVIKVCPFVIEDASKVDDCGKDIEATLLTGFISKGARDPVDFPADLNVSTAELKGATGDTRCVLGDVDDERGVKSADYRAYLCLVRLPDPDATWSGSLRLTALAVDTTVRVCRLEFPESSGGTANERNVQPYVAVKESLDSQNYRLTEGPGCPAVEGGVIARLHQTCLVAHSDATRTCP